MFANVCVCVYMYVRVEMETVRVTVTLIESDNTVRLEAHGERMREERGCGRGSDSILMMTILLH